MNETAHPRRGSLEHRLSKVHRDNLGRVSPPGTSLAAFINDLPDILAGADFKACVRDCLVARERGKGIIIGLGGHIIKTGVTPYLIALMQHGFIRALAMNGAAMIHDFEMAFHGATSEDVEQGLSEGTFGFSEETGRILNTIINEGVARGEGIGRAVSAAFQSSEFTHQDVSLIAQAGKLDIPLTVHVALGTDIIHMHPECDGAAIGQGTMDDFRLFCKLIATLHGGGGYINCGSAVLLPEVFLKALSLARNSNPVFGDFFTANFDFIRQYRPMTSVIARPKMLGARTYAFTGHHELLIPLLCGAILESAKRG